MGSENQSPRLAMNFTVYIFHFLKNGEVKRIPYAKWNRICTGEELADEFSSQVIYIAYAYISLKNEQPDYCHRLDGVIYYFDESGQVIIERPYYFDLLKDLEALDGGVIDFQHFKKNKMLSDKYQWELSARQIAHVLDLIWF